MKNLFLFLVLFAATSLTFGQNGPQIPLTGSIGVPGSAPTLCSSHVTIADANYTLTANQYACNSLYITSSATLTATRNIVAPLNYGQQFTVTNATTGGKSIQIIGPSGTGITVANGQTTIVSSPNGTGYVAAAANSLDAIISDPTGSQTITQPDNTTFNLIGSATQTYNQPNGSSSGSYFSNNQTFNFTGDSTPSNIGATVSRAAYSFNYTGCCTGTEDNNKWLVDHYISGVMNIMDKGIAQGIGITLNKYGTYDSRTVYGYNNNASGGSTGVSAEGSGAGSFQTNVNLPPTYGTLQTAGTAITAQAVVPSNTPTVPVLADMPSWGASAQRVGAGRYMAITSQSQLLYLSGGYTGDGGQNWTFSYPITTGTVPVSIAKGFITACTGNCDTSASPQTRTITVSVSSGTFINDATQLLCVAGGNFDTGHTSAVTAVSGGLQTITYAGTKPVFAGTTMIVRQGGTCGWGLAQLNGQTWTATQAAHNYTLVPSAGSDSSTSISLWLSTHGGQNGGGNVALPTFYDFAYTSVSVARDASGAVTITDTGNSTLYSGHSAAFSMASMAGITTVISGCSDATLNSAVTGITAVSPTISGTTANLLPVLTFTGTQTTAAAATCTGATLAMSGFNQVAYMPTIQIQGGGSYSASTGSVPFTLSPNAATVTTSDTIDMPWYPYDGGDSVFITNGRTRSGTNGYGFIPALDIRYKGQNGSVISISDNNPSTGYYVGTGGANAYMYPDNMLTAAGHFARGVWMTHSVGSYYGGVAQEFEVDAPYSGCADSLHGTVMLESVYGSSSYPFARYYDCSSDTMYWGYINGGQHIIMSRNNGTTFTQNTNTYGPTTYGVSASKLGQSKWFNSANTNYTQLLGTGHLGLFNSAGTAIDGLYLDSTTHFGSHNQRLSDGNGVDCELCTWWTGTTSGNWGMLLRNYALSFVATQGATNNTISFAVGHTYASTTSNDADYTMWAGGLIGKSVNVFGWAPTATGSGVPAAALSFDTALSRPSAGVVSVDTTIAGNAAGTLKAGVLTDGTCSITSGVLAGCTVPFASVSGNLQDAAANLGAVPYFTAAHQSSWVAPQSAASMGFFVETGTGTAGSAPVWFDLFHTANTWSAAQAFPSGTTAVTASAGDNSTKLATTAYVDAAVSGGGSGTVNSGTSGQIAYYAASGTAVSGTTALPNGTTATTQSATDNTNKVATTSFTQSAIASRQFFTNVSWVIQPSLFSTAQMLGNVYYTSYTNLTSYTQLTVRLEGTISCTAAPVVVLMDLGTNANTAYGSATPIASVTTGTSSGVYTGIGTAGIVSSHYYGIALSSGTCVTPPTISVSAYDTW